MTLADRAWDIYDGEDIHGSRLVRLTGADVLEGTGYRHAFRGTGSGQLVLRRAHSARQHLVRGHYVRCINLSPVGGGEEVDGGFFLDEGEEVVLSDKVTKAFTIGGPSTLAYLARAHLDNVSRSPTGGPFDQDWIDTDGERVWFGAGATQGYDDIIRRLIVEAALLTPNPIPAIDPSTSGVIPESTVSFEGYFRSPIGLNLLEEVLHVAQVGGLDLWIDPDTFLIRITDFDALAVDRTGGAFGAGVVRFEGGSNIAADLKRAVHHSDYVSHLVVHTADRLTVAVAIDPDWNSGEQVRYGELVLDVEDATEAYLEEVGLKDIELRKLETDEPRFPHLYGDSEGTGLYIPSDLSGSGHYAPGNYVTLHTGSGAGDFDEQTIQVAAVNWVMESNGLFRPWAELGSQYTATSAAALDRRLGGVSGCDCLQLCRPGFYGAGTSSVLDGAWGSNCGVGFCGWNVPDGTLDVLALVMVIGGDGAGTPAFTATLDGNPMTAVPGSRKVQTAVIPGRSDHMCTEWFYAPLGSNTSGGPEGHTYSFGGTGANYTGWMLLSNVDQADPIGAVATAIADSTTPAVNFSDIGGGAAVSGFAAYGNVDTTPAMPSMDAPGTLEWSESVITGAGLLDSAMGYGDVSASYVMADDKPWVATGIHIDGVGGEGTGGGDGRVELIGVGSRAKRCDDTEHYHTDRDPTVDDDSASGWRLGTLWVNESTGETWLLIDNSVGAADWLALAGGVTDHGALTGLGDDDHTQYTRKATLTAKGSIYAAGAASTPAELAVGSNGQVLTADSGEATGVKWATPGSGSSPLTTKGDVHGYDTADARLPVGSNGQVLTADSAQSLGIKWATPGAGSGTSPEWWDSPNAPGATDDDEFDDGTVPATRVYDSGTPKGSWVEEADGLVWTHSANMGSELDVFAVAPGGGLSVGDYVSVAARFPPYVPNYMGVYVGFSNGTTYGTSNAVGVDAHLAGGVGAATYRHMLNAYPGFNTRGTDGTIADFLTPGQIMGWRVKYEAANTWGLYLRAPGTRVWRKVQSNYSYTLTPTHVIFGIHSIASPAYSADNGAGIRLECVRIND